MIPIQREGKVFKPHQGATAINRENKAPPGTYTLLFQIDGITSLQIGRLGHFHLQPGYYAYVGSAMGPGGLRARIGRHLRPPSEKRSHWHVDRLAKIGKIIEVWVMVGTQRNECTWSETLASVGDLAVPGFGASDCRCQGHLIWLRDGERLRRGLKVLERKAGKKLKRWKLEGESSEKTFHEIGANTCHEE